MPIKKTPKKKAPAKPKGGAGKRQSTSGTINKNAKKQLDKLRKQGF